MTTRKLLSAASVLMLLAGTPVLAMAEDAAPAATEAPAVDEEQAADEAAAPADAAEQTTEEAAPAE